MIKLLEIKRYEKDIKQNSLPLSRTGNFSEYQVENVFQATWLAVLIMNCKIFIPPDKKPGYLHMQKKTHWSLRTFLHIFF